MGWGVEAWKYVRRSNWIMALVILHERLAQLLVKDMTERVMEILIHCFILERTLGQTCSAAIVLIQARMQTPKFMFPKL
jgi:hypothetical protein